MFKKHISKLFVSFLLITMLLNTASITAFSEEMYSDAEMFVEETGKTYEEPDGATLDEVVTDEERIEEVTSEEEISEEETTAGEVPEEETPEEETPEEEHPEAEPYEESGFQMHNVPVVYIHIDESRGTIEDMNASEDHSTNCYGTVDIVVPEGYSSEYMDGIAESVAGLTMEYIRGRGNSTWRLDKKPYKIKFEKGVDLFGMGKDKHWGLLANRMDDTMLKNRIALWLAQDMDMEYTPQSIPVDVVMNGTYLGSYLLAETVRVSKARVNIDELEEDITDEPDVTGGYLLAIGTQEIPADPDNHFTTEKGVVLNMENPEFEEGEYKNDIQRDYIRDYFQKVENAIFGEGFMDSEGHSYGEYLDIASAVDFWWIQELTRNPDGFSTGSTYLYKKRDGKLYFGPLWDFDAAWNWGNVSPEGMPTVYLLPWYSCLFTDPAFTEAVIQRWSTVRESIDELVQEDGVLNIYNEEITASRQADREIWGPYDEETGEQTVEDLRTWIIDRRNWIDGYVDNIRNMIHTVRFADGDTVLDTQYIIDKATMYKFPEAPEKDGYYFTGWYSDDDTRIDETVEILKDMQIRPVYIEDSEVTKGQELYFTQDHLYIPIQYYEYSISYMVLPEDAMDKSVRWTSSDSSIVSVDDTGTIRLLEPGTATVTGTLSSGNSSSYTITVYDGDETGEDTDLDELVLDHTDLTLREGEYGHITVSVYPPYMFDYYLMIESENPGIAEAYPSGVIKGISPGTTRIIVRDEWSGKTAVCVVTVIGSEDEEPETKETEPETKETKPETEPETEPETGAPEPEKPDHPDSDADANIPSRSSDNPDIPNTGDGQAPYLWFLLMGISALLLGLSVSLLVRKNG